MQTLGDLRRLLTKELQLSSDETELWISPSSDSGGSTHSGGGGRGNGNAGMGPEEPRGEKAAFDNMSLGHYGLGHGSTVDVRLCVSSGGGAGPAARAGDGGGAAAVAVEGTGSDAAVGIWVKTNAMMLRDEDGLVRISA